MPHPRTIKSEFLASSPGQPLTPGPLIYKKNNSRPSTFGPYLVICEKGHNEMGIWVPPAELKNELHKHGDTHTGRVWLQRIEVQCSQHRYWEGGKVSWNHSNHNSLYLYQYWPVHCGLTQGSLTNELKNQHVQFLNFVAFFDFTVLGYPRTLSLQHLTFSHDLRPLFKNQMYIFF